MADAGFVGFQHAALHGVEFEPGNFVRSAKYTPPDDHPRSFQSYLFELPAGGIFCALLQELCMLESCLDGLWVIVQAPPPAILAKMDKMPRMPQCFGDHYPLTLGASVSSLGIPSHRWFGYNSMGATPRRFVLLLLGRNIRWYITTQAGKIIVDAD